MESARQKGPAHCVRRNPSHNWLFMVDFFGFGAIFGGFIHILGVFRRISSPVHSAAHEHWDRHCVGHRVCPNGLPYESRRAAELSEGSSKTT